MTVKLFEISLPLLPLRALTFKTVSVFKQKDAKGKKKKIKITEAKKPKELFLIGTTLSLCQTNLTEFLDFHILAVSFRMVTAIYFYSCGGMNAPALLGVLLET